MEQFWIQLLSILTLLTQTSSPSDTTEIRGVGESVTFRSPSTDTKPALWSFGNIPIVLVLFEDPPRPVFYQDKFQARFAVSEGGRALSISQLSLEDAGTYSVNVGGRKSTFNLRVYKELTEPRVTCETQECSGSICLFSLHCSVTDTGFGNVSYTWTGWGNLQDDGSVVLPVNKSSQDNLDPLMCTALNAVSSRNVTVTNPEGLCPDTPSGSWLRIGLVAGMEIAAILSVCLIFFCKSKGHGPAPRGRAGEWLI